MRRNAPLGCLSFSGISATFAVVLIIVGMGFFRGGWLFSPGELNARAGDPLGGVGSHAQIQDCAACHTAPWSSQTMSAQCVACHTDLTRDPRNFHNQMLAQGKQQGCTPCHTEHHGAEGSLTVMDLKDFNHNQVGFSLQAHQKQADGAAFQCADCHGASYARFDLTVCAECHAKLDAAFMQNHSAAFGAECLGCHDGLDSYGKTFDHQAVAFKLLGKHAPLACDGCHSGARTVADLKGAHQECATCHARDDIHQGSFGAACGTCHTPEGWEPANFDHAQTAFPLLGKHQAVDCQGCHLNQVFKGTPQACDACHAKDDAHQGDFGKECGACHSPEGWEPAHFDHSQTPFPLTGKHLSLHCKSCHTNQLYMSLPTVCSGCHKDPAYHQGMFGADCAGCHTTAAWVPAEFTGAHSFPIHHGGANTCRQCHPSSLQAYTCSVCHDQGQMVRKHQEEGITNISNCVGCHAGGRSGEHSGD